MTEISRRSVAKGLAWAAPVAVAASAAPAAAASRPGTVAVTPQAWQTAYSRTPSFCNTSTNPQKGFIDTLCCNSPVKNRTTGVNNADCKQDPNTSQGYWLESASAGYATIDAIKVTYTFNYPVAFDQCTYGQGNANTSGTWTWNSCNVLGAGWTITNTTSTSITLVYSGSGLQPTSTGTAGTGFCTGYFINFRATQGCYGTGVLKFTTAITMTYTDSTGTKTYTKNTSTGI